MMLIEANRHLTYCTNIHPSKGWDNVLANIKRYTTDLKERLSPDERFGVGLILSNRELTELNEGNRLEEFKRFMDESGLYIFTMNGFVYGEFHNPRIKDTIYKPDWRTIERVRFSRGLVDVLADLLPDDMNEGSFSTSPLSYKYWDDVDPNSEYLWKHLTENIVRVVKRMVLVRDQKGKFIHMDMEPEPDCLIETSAEMAAFFENWMLDYGADQLATSLRISKSEAQAHILDHLQVCYDTCHVAVEYERADDVLDRYERLGVKVGKLQISSALTVPLTDDMRERGEQAEWLDQFAEDNFLHQVVQRNNDGSFTRYRDLPLALPNIGDPNAAEWRIHYHVPIFVDSYQPGTWTTQEGIIDAFSALQRRNYTNFLEIETYTWEVLPEDLRLPLTESIEREFRWVKECL